MNKRVSQCLEGRDNNFDFIRFIASLAVLFSHSYVLAQNIQDPVASLTHENYSVGGFAVITFFIISGFLITRSYHRSKSFTEYVLARTLRIYPALFVTVLITALVIGPLATDEGLTRYFTSSLTWKYPLSGFALRIYETLPGVFTHNPFSHIVNGSLWTLPHEVMCYFMVAAFGLLLSRNIKMFLIVASLIAFVIYIDKYIFLKWKFYWDACWFFFGALVYIFRNRIVLNLNVALCCIALLVLNIYFDHNFYICNVITGLLSTYIIITLSFIKSNRLKNFSKYGDFSYGVYIWGFVIQQVVAMAFTNFNHYYNFLVSALIVLPLSYLSWHLIEKRALKFKSDIKKHLKENISIPVFQTEAT